MTRAALAVAAGLIFFASFLIPFLTGIPRGWEQYIGIEQGAAITGWITVLNWYFGSSKRDENTPS